MKKSFKILLAVVALAAYGCTTDTTEDLGVNIGGQTSITLSLEESRTHLGEKADGVYPLYWSEGDQIAVNGDISTALTAEESGLSSATFSFDGKLTHPYSVVYPAPAEGVVAESAGCYPVVFPAAQTYIAGSIAKGAATMYGYAATANDAIQLHHLTGVLRLAVKGEGVTLRSLNIEAESGNLSGTYDVNCENGALTAHSDASNTVVVTFGEGLALGAEATPIYVAVPAGTYGKISLTLNSTTDSMLLSFDTASKPIAAGTVREFAEFNYAANASENEVYLIDSKEALIQFASIAADFAPYKKAKVVAPIDMTGVEWSPIEGFGYEFDGDNNEIKGLTAPLFGTTAASIKNLKLTNVNITSNGLLHVGAVACTLLNDGFGGATVSNCSVSGKITIANPDYTPVAVEDSLMCDIVDCGGVVGFAQGATISNCVNEATIQVNQIATAGHTVTLRPAFGGIVGAVTMNGDVQSQILNCENKGAINYHDSEKTQIYYPGIGGVVGINAWEDAYDGLLSGCVNRGAIDLNANINGAPEIEIKGALALGGIAGVLNGSTTDCDNYGKITISGGNVKTMLVGGIAGMSRSRILSDCHNHTSATIDVSEDVVAWSVNVAGLVSTHASSSLYENEELVDSSNDGAITVKCSIDKDVALGNYYYRVAGIICYANITSRNCENKANGDITVSGDIILARANSQPCYGVCGTVAYHTTSGNTYTTVNRGDINVYTNVSLHSDITKTDYGKLNIGGLGGYHTRALGDKAENYGHITIGKEGVEQTIAANGIYIAGLMAYGTSISCNPVNEGHITIHDKVNLTSGTEIHIGGISGLMTGNVSNATNKGNITVAGSSESAYHHIGGIVGYLNKESGSYTIANCTNSGNITTNSTITSGSTNGGIVGRAADGVTFTDCSNSGNVTLNGTTTTHTFTSGIIGMAAAATFTNCSNTGNMLVASTASVGGELYMAGVAGYTNAATLTTCSNSGSVSMNATKATLNANAGIVGRATAASKATDCSNTGDVTLNGQPTNHAFVAGIIGYVPGTVFTNCHNNGVMTVTKVATAPKELYMAGITGYSTAASTFDNCSNSTKAGVKYGIVMSKEASATGGGNGMRIGGIFGRTGGVTTMANGVTNSAGILVDGNQLGTAGLSIGGIAGLFANGEHQLKGLIHNSGLIHYKGRCPRCNFGFGGCIASPGSKSVVYEKIVNTGDIIVERLYEDSFPLIANDAAKSINVGGVVGNGTSPLTNAQCFCKMTLVDFNKDSTSNSTFGMLKGVASSGTSVTNSKCGGSVATTTSFQPDPNAGAEDQGATIELPDFVPIDASNFLSYIYSDTITAEKAATDNVTYINSIEEVDLTAPTPAE